MKKTDIARLGHEDIIRLIGKEWMLVAAGTPDRYNMMTASWGGVGYLWNKPVCFVFIRPERYTYGFAEEQQRMTLSFLQPGHREALNVCGTRSGRDTDKAALSGLHPLALAPDAVGFGEARLTLVCRKLYRTDLQAEGFIDREALSRWYNDRPGGSLHAVYVCEIEEVYEA
ncbi:MAG: flavin reductase family protein [Alloprevotella sp.]